jgi:16S rRNA (guanine966-N2)-methyltransferase
VKGAGKPGRLRIVAGLWRGRLIAAPADQAVRPTAARAREALFNRLAHGFAAEEFSLAGARVIDVCAGSGVLGLEALSRGAAAATFVDRAPAALSLLRANTGVLAADACALPRARQPCDLAFVDPPYGEGLAPAILTALRAQGWLRPGAVVSVETGADESLEPPPGYVLHDRRVYGRAALWLLRSV